MAWATTWIDFYILTFIIGFGAITNLVQNRPISTSAANLPRV